MKKILTILALTGVASLSYGQGLVSFANGVSATTHVSTNNSSAQGITTDVSSLGRITTAVGGTYYFALLQAPSTQNTITPSLAGWTAVPGVGTNTTLGRFTGNPSTAGLPVSGNPGEIADFSVVGWSANIGNTFAQASAYWNLAQSTGVAFTGWFGISGVANDVVIGGGAIPVPTIFGPNAGQTLGFNLLQVNPVPEPSSIALAGLGAASLLLFRRRK